MDRNNIQCEYAEGYTGPNNTGAHSWNIVTIDGKKYPIDLTWDNTAYRSGKSKSLDWFCKSPKEFAECHKPSSFEATQNYERTLSQINPQLPKKLYAKMGLQGTTDYRSTTFYGTRSDGSKFLVSQVGENRINNKTYYRHNVNSFYFRINKQNKNISCTYKSKTIYTYYEFYGRYLR